MVAGVSVMPLQRPRSPVGAFVVGGVTMANPRRSTAERGYGQPHKRARAALAPTVQDGQAWCAETICLKPTRWIDPHTAWDLAHDRANPGQYLGPAHAKCNRSEGARWQARTSGAAKGAGRRWVL